VSDAVDVNRHDYTLRQAADRCNRLGACRGSPGPCRLLRFT
jgi:hypothetical protein